MRSGHEAKTFQAFLIMSVTRVTFVMYVTKITLVMCVIHVTFLMCVTYITLVTCNHHDVCNICNVGNECNTCNLKFAHTQVYVHQSRAHDSYFYLNITAHSQDLIHRDTMATRISDLNLK